MKHFSWVQKIYSYFIPVTIAQFNSDYNGEIRVVSSVGSTYIEAGGLMQSGPFLAKIWKKGLTKLHINKGNIQKVLVLGLGGGSVIQTLNTLYPAASITAVDIDSMMVEIGKKYLSFKAEHVQLIIGDAQKYVRKNQHSAFDLIVVDLYVGYSSPEFISDNVFLQDIYTMLSPEGTFVINHLYWQKHKIGAQKLLDKLHQTFQDVKAVHVYSNLLVAVTRH